MHALHGLDLRLVADGADGHAQARRVLHGRLQHAVDRGVDAVVRPARRFLVGVQTLDRLADPAELPGIPERDAARIGHRQVQRLRRDLAIAQAAPGGGVEHLARFGGQLADRHAQALGAGLEQHHAGQRAEPAHRRVAHAHRHAAAGDAHAVGHHRVLLAVGRIVDDETGRIGIQFLADDLRHGGEHALPALVERTLQADGVVRQDGQEGGNHCPGRRAGIRARPHGAGAPQRQAEAEHEGARRDAGRAQQELATGDVGRRLVDRERLALLGRVVVARRHERALPSPYATLACSAPSARSCTAAWMAL